MRFVLIDESIVDRGFWVLVSGIILELFKKNPVMYWMHQRPSIWDGRDGQMLPIGRWENIKVETIKGAKSVTAEPVFDEDDEFALKIKKKVDNNFIRMASAGLRLITISEDPKYLKKGQTRATLVASEMIEASIVDIGSNRNAIRLYNEEGNIIELSDVNNSFIPTLNQKTKEDMKLIALKLGLKEDATEAEILAAIDAIEKSEKQKKAIAETLQAERVSTLLKSDALTDDVKESIEKLAKSDFELAQKMVATLEKKEDAAGNKTVRLSDILQKKNLKGEEINKKWADYSDQELETLREEKTDEYVKLFTTEYGYEPKLD